MSGITQSRSGRAVVHVTDEDKREFGVMVDSEAGYREYVLAELRAARIRARLLVKEIETIGLALSRRLIDPDTAVEWLNGVNALDFLQRETGDETVQSGGAIGGG